MLVALGTCCDVGFKQSNPKDAAMNRAARSEQALT